MNNPCNELDKRTKAYKECLETSEYQQWKENFEQQNTIKAGDVVEKITKATGIKKVVEAITDDCGCDKRKEKLNQYQLRTKECPTQQEFEYIKNIIERPSNKLNFEEQKEVVRIYNKVFKRNQKASKCGSCYAGIINALKNEWTKY